MTTHKELELKQIFEENYSVTIDVQVSPDHCQQYTYFSFCEAKSAIEAFENTTTVYF
jgi:hypothetical protein